VIIVLVVAVVLPRALRDENRLEKNLCMHCGYDLRQSPDRCPECGQPTKLPDPPAPNLDR
jgi:predicted amidophosphoribosyltransferase